MFSRSDNSIVAKWWWSVDKWSLVSLFAIMAIGIFLNFSASPAVAERIGMADHYGLLKKQMLFLPLAICCMLFISFQNERMVRRYALIIFVAALILTMLTLTVGTDASKGAKRWIYILGFSLQPSEFLKPTFCVLSAYILADGKQLMQRGGIIISAALLIVIDFLLILQPDIGMMFTISMIWAAQVFIAGIPIAAVSLLTIIGILVTIALYFLFPHFQFRIDSFFDSGVGDNYQINQAIDAFRSGGFFGIGPGEGKIKIRIPDAHTDFIMAVAGEEFGFIFCMLIILLFAFIVFRGFSLALKENKLFCLLAVAGLLVQFGFQAIVNMSSSLHLIPTKGMTLPFISHGGSSLVSIALGMGFVLALTKRQNLNGE